MTETVIGSCSICGGDVVKYMGVWMSILPPPPATCRDCGATESRGPVIPMVSPSGRRERYIATNDTTKPFLD